MESSIVNDVERIVKMSHTVEINGVTYSARDLKPVFDETKVETIKVGNIQAIIDYVDDNPDGLDRVDLIVHVLDENNVFLTRKFALESKVRMVFMHAKNEQHNFSFGRFINHEDFIIKLQSMFVDTPDRARVILYVSKLTTQNSIQLEDDGITQMARVTKGVSGAVKEMQPAPSMVNLRPFRTFAEIEQPESTFLLRLSQKGGDVPECALFEADGGMWRNKAIKNIKAYLREQEAFGNTTILA